MFVCIYDTIIDYEIEETVTADAVTVNNLQTQLSVVTCCGYCSELAASFLNGVDTQVQGSVTAGANVQC